MPKRLFGGGSGFDGSELGPHVDPAAHPDTVLPTLTYVNVVGAYSKLTTYFMPDGDTLDLGFERPSHGIGDAFDRDAVRAASHARLVDRGHTAYDWQHYIDLVQRKPGALRNGTPFMDLPAPLASLRQALMRREGGDRLMAEVLSLVPASGLDAVLVAVELVLEHASPSGQIGVEHIQNVLARLKDPQRPPPVHTHLTLKDAPLADTTRYDRLRQLSGCKETMQENSHAN